MLTSTYGLPAGERPPARAPSQNGQRGSGEAGDDSPIYRELLYHTVPPYPVKALRQRALIEYRDVRALRRVLAAEQPELIYVWNMGGMIRSLLAVAHDYPAPVVYELGDTWLARAVDVWEWAEFWQRPAQHPIKRGLKAPAKLLAGRLTYVDTPVVDLRHVLFITEKLKQNCLALGMPAERGRVIYLGVNRQFFHPPPNGARREPGCRVLYVGQFAEHKGVHTLVEAFARLQGDPAQAGTTLTLCGGSIHPEYVAALQAAIRTHGLEERVRFQESLPRYELTPIYHAHDVLVFPSIWEEPYGLGQVEAMACGIPVIGTGTGGSAEILTEETALRFPPGNAVALAERIATLAADPARRRRMGAAALERVDRHFDLRETVRQTDAYLREVLAAPRTPAARVRWKLPLPGEPVQGRIPER